MRTRRSGRLGSPRCAIALGGAELLAKYLGRNFLDLSLGERTQLEWAVGHSHQTIDPVAEILADHSDFSILALAQPEGQPGIASYLFIQARLDGAVGDTIDGDALR